MCWVPIPKAPRTQSLIQLSSIHAIPGRGNYGDPNFSGNCSGLLIADLLRFYGAKRVLDPMAGSGTCGDVCRDLQIECECRDLINGFDAVDPASFAGLGKFDFIWLHPPYGRMYRWTYDERCLAESESEEQYFQRLESVLQNCMNVLSESGRLAILAGDWRNEGEYLELPFRAYEIARRMGLRFENPEMIRPTFGSSSNSIEYSGSFIPRIHDMCLVFKRRFKSRRLA